MALGVRHCAMAIYLVTPLAHNGDQISSALKAKVAEDDRHELQNRAGWLVSFKGTSVELSHLIGITSKEPTETLELGSAMVTSVGSYYGRGSAAMWEWLKTRFESQR